MGSKWKTHLQPLLLPQGLKDVGPARPGASMGHAVKEQQTGWDLRFLQPLCHHQLIAPPPAFRRR